MESGYRLKDDQKKELCEILNLVTQSNYQVPNELEDVIQNLISNIDNKRKFSEDIDEIIRNIPISDNKLVDFKLKIHQFRTNLVGETPFGPAMPDIDIIKF